MKATLQLSVNGSVSMVEIDTRATLVDVIREVYGLTATHIGCRTGHCGVCTVVLDGRTVKGCCVLAVDCDGQRVETAESLCPDPAELHPLQRALMEAHGLQCGYCTPGLSLRIVELLDEFPEVTEEAVRRELKGNLCRCTGYHNIVAAVMQSAART